VLDNWGPTFDDVLDRVRAATSREFDVFAPAALAAADAGDPVAELIKTKAVQELTSILASLERKMPQQSFDFSTAGSLARELLPDILAGAPERVRREHTLPKASPDIGALWIAISTRPTGTAERIHRCVYR
jgi:N-acetylglucosamine kinase-like BadF-type ATPase